MRLASSVAAIVLLAGPLLLPHAAQAALSAELSAQVHSVADPITTACQMERLTDAQIECLYATNQQNLAACMQSQQEGTLIQKTVRCVFKGVAESEALLSGCVSGLSAAQKTCALQKAGEAVAAFNRAVSSVSGGGAGTTQTTPGMAAGDFVPLTNIPGIAEAAQSRDLSGLLNTIYKLCIGIAAVLAVVQILRGGLTYMLGDSVTEKREARHHIYMAVFGLLLVLSPAIVFGIIDRRILDLKINVEGLNWTPAADVTLGGGAQPTTTTSPVELENTCTNAQYKTTIETALREWREDNPAGSASFNITSQGQAGMGCCAAVKDTDGSSCRGSRSQSFSRSDALIITYSCTCDNGRRTGGDGKWRASEIVIRVDLRNADVGEGIKNSTPQTFATSRPRAYDTEAECEAVAGYGETQLLDGIKANNYICPSSGGGNCSQRVDYLKRQDSVPAGTLTLQSRTCAQGD